MQTIKIFFLISPFLYELITECYNFIVRGKPDDHKKSTWIRAAMIVTASIGVAFYNQEYGYWIGLLQCFIFASGVYIFFDPFMNLIRRYIGKQKHVHFFYYGNSWTDQRWKMLPPHVQVFVRLWVASVVYCVYFQMDQILGYTYYGY